MPAPLAGHVGSLRQAAPLFVSDIAKDAVIEVEVTLGGHVPTFTDNTTCRVITLSWPDSMFECQNPPAPDDPHAYAYKATEKSTYTWRLKRTDAQCTGDAKFVASVDSITPDDEHGRFDKLTPVSFGKDAAGGDIEVKPKAIAGDPEITRLVGVDATMFLPPVIDGHGLTEISEDEEIGSGAGFGGVAFVNLDNDDMDAYFDLSDTFGVINTSTGVTGDDELVRLHLRLPSYMPTGALVRVDVTKGSSDIALWCDGSKAVPYVVGAPISLDGDGNGLIGADLWIEGISPHSAPQGTRIRAEYILGSAVLHFDEIDLTVLGVESVKWSARFNGYSTSSTTCNALDADTNWPSGLSPQGLRVFPGLRSVNGVMDTIPRSCVDLSVCLSAPTPRPVCVFVKAFDIDDPSDNDGPIDDDSQATAIDDNFDGSWGFNAGGGSLTPMRQIQFAAATQTEKATFLLGKQPGDNYRVVASVDSKFLDQLENVDHKGHGHRVVCPVIAGTVAAQEVLEPLAYCSVPLTVWRLLHVEADSMQAGVAATANLVECNAVPSPGHNPTDYPEWRVYVDGDVHDGSPCRDQTSVAPLGRFEGGKFWACDATGAWAEFAIVGNGVDSAFKQFVDTSSATGTPATPIPCTVTNGTNTQDVGVLRFFESSDMGVGIKFGSVLNSNVNGGNVNMGGVAISETSDVDGSVAYSNEAPFPSVPVRIRDDDKATLAPPDLHYLLTDNLFKPAYVLPVHDDCGVTGSSTNTVDFVLNVSDPLTQVRNAFDSRTNRSSDFWIAYILNAYQAQTDRDRDPDTEMYDSGDKIFNGIMGYAYSSSYVLS